MIVAGPDFRVPPQATELQIIFLVLVLASIAQQSPDAKYTLTSWYRTPERNRQVGGVANSLHVQGLAIDVVIERGFISGVIQGIRDELSGVSIFQRGLAGAWRALAPPFTQAQVESDHLHLELDLN